MILKYLSINKDHAINDDLDLYFIMKITFLHDMHFALCVPEVQILE